MYTLPVHPYPDQELAWTDDTKVWKSTISGEILGGPCSERLRHSWRYAGLAPSLKKRILPTFPVSCNMQDIKRDAKWKFGAVAWWAFYLTYTSRDAGLGWWIQRRLIRRFLEIRCKQINRQKKILCSPLISIDSIFAVQESWSLSLS